MKSVLSFILLTIVIAGCKKNNSVETESNNKDVMAQVIQKSYPKTSNYPEADQFDDEMEEDFVTAANEFQKEIIAQETLITSRNWVVYNDNNGRPIKRNRIAVVTAEYSGRCFLQHMFFQQDAKGSSYGKTYVTDVYGWKEFDCSLKQ